MKDRQLDNKIQRDFDNTKNELGNLAEDGASRLSNVKDDISDATAQTEAGITTWVGDNASKMSKELGKLTGEARESMAGAAAALKKDLGNGLSQYNTKVQQMVDKAPGGLRKQAAKYPWVALSITVAAGFFLGMLMRPARQPLR